MKQTGWRKPTPGLGVAEQLAQAGEPRAIHKNRAFLAVKRVGAHIGLKPGDMMLLDTLGAFTQAQDWESGRRPIVWPSNARLVEQTGFSLSALKRHTRRLAEKGVIAFKDSPNGKRWGRRDADGVIVEAYGIDLSPLCARAEDFERLHAEIKAERDICQRLKRQITISRRTIRARIEAAHGAAMTGPWAQYHGLFQTLLVKLPRRHVPAEALERLLSWFRALQHRVDVAFLSASGTEEAAGNPNDHALASVPDAAKPDPRGVNSGPHIQTMNQPESSKGNTLQKEDPQAVAPPDSQRARNTEQPVTQSTKNHPMTLKLPLLLQACPEFTTWARDFGGYLRNWGDLHRIAGQLGPMIGVCDRAWQIAQDRLGRDVATAAFVLVFEKHCAGEVTSPSGYLRGMVEKAGAGELHLARSLHGRLRRTAA